MFVAGDVNRLASIKIRCREIARRLGMECSYNELDVDNVPGGYRAYICVKPNFGRNGDALAKLARRGLVVWDILDDRPPPGMHHYIASTAAAARVFSHLGAISIIPHYHCNFENLPSRGAPEAVGYIGSIHWYPHYTDVDHRKHFVDRWTREEVAGAYRRVGIGINHRNTGPVGEKFLTSKLHVKPDPNMHVKINSGIKLLNCIGFGIPSVCPNEPAYEELGEGCTVITDIPGCRAAVDRLKGDRELYRGMQARCLERRHEYHVTKIADMYRRLIKSL